MVNLETSSETVTILKGAAATADIVIGTIGGALQTDGVKLELLQVLPDYVVGITMVHDATGTTDLEYTHSEIQVTRGAALSLDNLFDTTGGATQGVGIFLVDSNPSTNIDTYLVVVVHLAA